MGGIAAEPSLPYVNPRIDWNCVNWDEGIMRGPCQEPILLDGDYGYFSLNVKPKEGEYALIRMHVQKVDRLTRKPIGTDYINGIKRLVRRAGGWCWAGKINGRESFVPVFGHEPIGVLMLAVRYPGVQADSKLWLFGELRDLYLRAPPRQA